MVLPAQARSRRGGGPARSASLRGAGVRPAALAPGLGRRAASGASAGWPRPRRCDAFAETGRARPCRPRRPGVRVAGDRDAQVTTVAVCGGAGDDLFDDVRRRGADVFVTADLRHHPASEALEHGRPALVDCAHWATEWPWLRDAERLLRDGLADAGLRWRHASRVVTDPWSCHLVTDPWTVDPRSHTESRRADQQRLLDVQALDTRIDQLDPPPGDAARARGPGRAGATAVGAARPDRRGADRGERPRPRAEQGRGRRRPGARARRARPAADGRRARSPRPRTSRASSTRSRPWPGGRATSRTSCST